LAGSASNLRIEVAKTVGIPNVARVMRVFKWPILVVESCGQSDLLNGVYIRMITYGWRIEQKLFWADR
jgi:hypothetical protein